MSERMRMLSSTCVQLEVAICIDHAEDHLSLTRPDGTSIYTTKKKDYTLQILLPVVNSILSYLPSIMDHQYMRHFLANVYQIT